MPSYRIEDRYNSIFGFVSRNVTPRVANLGLGGSLLPYGVFHGFETLKNTDKSIPAFDEISLEHPDFSNGVYKFEIPPLIDFSRKKIITETPINDGDGEVVEDFGMSAWHFTIKGLLIDVEDHLYPQQKKAALSEMFDIRDTVDVIADYFNDIGITSIYFKNIAFRDSADFPDTVGYTLYGKSHADISFTID